MKLRASILTRVSTADQAVHGHSLEMQYRRCMEVIESQGWEYIDHYEGRGESAFLKPLDERPSTRELLVDAEAAKFDIVVAWSSDRTQRDADGESLYSALKRRGASLYDVTDGRQDDSIESVLLRNGRRIAGHLESAHKSERMRAHVRGRAERGLHLGAIPFGYRRGTDGVAEPESETAPAVREVFERTRAGESHGAIARRLNGQGLRTQRGLLFTSWAVRDMLKCRFHLGEIVLNGNVHSGRHEAIVDRELFEAVQSSKRSPERTNWAPTVKSCLDGLVACAHCGGGIQRDTVRGQPRFRERHGRECPTNGRSRMAAAFEDDVRTVFSALELPEHWRHDMASRAASLAGPPLEELQRKRRRLVRAFGDDVTAFDEAEYERRLDALDAEIRAARRPNTPSYEDAAGVLDDLPRLWLEATHEERRQLLAPLVERVYIDLDAARVTGILPTDPFRDLLRGALWKVDGSDLRLLSPEELGEMYGLVEIGGLEPPTSSLRTTRSPN